MYGKWECCKKIVVYPVREKTLKTKPSQAAFPRGKLGNFIHRNKESFDQHLQLRDRRTRVRDQSMGSK